MEQVQLEVDLEGCVQFEKVQGKKKVFWVREVGRGWGREIAGGSRHRSIQIKSLGAGSEETGGEGTPQEKPK